PVLFLRALSNVERPVLRPDVVNVAKSHRCTRSQSAVRNQTETAVHLRPEAGQVEAGAEDLRVFDLVDLRRAALVERGFERTRWRQAASVAHFVTLGVEADGAVARKDLRIQLRIDVAQNDVVERTEAARGKRLLRGDFLIAFGEPTPDVIAPDRTADLSAVIAHVVDAVCLCEVRLGLSGNCCLCLLTARRIEVTTRSLQ